MVDVAADPNGDLTVKVEDWTIRVFLASEYRGLTRRAFEEQTERKRKVWLYEVKGPLFPFGEAGGEKTRGDAWTKALTMIPQGFLLRHWPELPHVPNAG